MPMGKIYQGYPPHEPLIFFWCPDGLYENVSLFLIEAGALSLTFYTVHFLHLVVHL